MRLQTKGMANIAPDGGADKARRDNLLTKAATRYAGRWVDIRNKSAKWKNLAWYFK